MKGLLLKDLYTLKGYGKQYAMIIFFLSVWSILAKNMGFITIYLIILGGMMATTTMSVDESTGFGRLALSMPVSPNTLVKSKYVLLFLTVGSGTGLSLFSSFIASAISYDRMIDMEWESILISATVFWIIYAITLPITFWLGAEKSRYIYVGIMMVFAILIIGGINGLKKIGIDLDRLEQPSGFELWAGLLIVVIVVMLISYQCSLKVIQKKEW